MPTATNKEIGIAHFVTINGHRPFVRSAGWDAGREMLAANYVDKKVLDVLHGMFFYKIPLAGDLTQATTDELLGDLQGSPPADVLYMSVGPSIGDAAALGVGTIDGMPHERAFNAIATWATQFQTKDGTHMSVNTVGTVDNFLDGPALGTGTTVSAGSQFVDAVAADEEIICIVAEPDRPGPSTGSTLTVTLENATDSIFTTPVSQIVLATMDDTAGAAVFGSVAGPFAANLFWRAERVVTGTTPSRFPAIGFGKRKSSTFTA